MLYVHKFISGWLLPPGGIIVMLFYCAVIVLRNAADFVILNSSNGHFISVFDSSCCRNADAGTGKAVCSSGVGKNNR